MEFQYFSPDQPGLALPVQCQVRQVQRLLVHWCFGLEGAVHQKQLQDEGPPVHKFVPVNLWFLLQKWPDLRADW